MPVDGGLIRIVLRNRGSEKYESAPAGSYQVMDSLRKTAATITATIGVRYVTLLAMAAEVCPAM